MHPVDSKALLIQKVPELLAVMLYFLCGGCCSLCIVGVIVKLKGNVWAGTTDENHENVKAISLWPRF
jgi:hypothetical protein